MGRTLPIPEPIPKPTESFWEQEEIQPPIKKPGILKRILNYIFK